ncbi:MAG: hypothetical protein EOO63_17255, partial [Hymenobacter sp.]
TRLFISMGKKDRLHPRDVVDLIGESTNLPGNKVGDIALYDKFSFVEVPNEFAEEIVGQLGRSSIQGQPVTFSIATPVQDAAAKEEGTNRPERREGGFGGGERRGGFGGGDRREGGRPPFGGGNRGGSSYGDRREGGSSYGGGYKGGDRREGGSSYGGDRGGSQGGGYQRGGYKGGQGGGSSYGGGYKGKRDSGE